MKKLLFTLITATICGISAFAYDFSAVCESGQTLYYNIISNTEPYTVQVTYPNYYIYTDDYYDNYTRPTGDLTIPSSVTNNGITYLVTGIGNDAFYDCEELTSVIIPNSVTSIGDGAFFGCERLRSINIPNSVTSIGERAFAECFGLTTINIPNSVTSIFERAFENCIGLTSITIPNSVTIIGDYAFGACSGLSSVTIGNSVESIGEGAFHACMRLTSITIPNSVTIIGEGAFSACFGLSSVTIGNSVTSFDGAFLECSGLETLVVNSGNTTYDSRENCNAIIETATNTLVLGCQNTIIPNSVTSIGQSAFSGCSGLISVAIPNSVTSIGGSAFYGCSGLTLLTIGNGVTSIGESAFADCSGLTMVNFNATTCTTMGSYVQPVFYGCTSLATLNIGENVSNIPEFAFEHCSGLTSVTIPNSITSIGECAFAYCIGLTTVTIGNSVTSIGNFVFSGCSGLASITSLAIVPPQAGMGAFQNVSAIIPVYVPCGTVLAYQNAGEWSNFTNIQANPDAVFPYTAEVQSANPEFGSVEITHNPDCNEPTFSVQAMPIEHYHLVSWSNGSTEPSLSIVVTQDTLLVATFAIDQHTLSINSDNETMGGVTGFGTYDYNSSREISAEPNYGYHFTEWNDGVTDNPRMVNVLSDTLFTAYFDNNDYVLTVESDSSVMGLVEGGDTYRYLDVATITAVPNYGYHFTHWNDGNTDNPRTVNILSDTLFTAYFDNNDYMLIAETSDWDMGSVEGGDTYRYLDVAPITAVPNYGYHFTEWNDGVTDNPRLVNVLSDTVFTAHFDYNEYNIVAESANEDMGTVDGGSTYRYLEEAILNANANEGYIFVRWNDGNTDNPRFVTVERDSTFTATFGILNEMTITDCNNYDLGEGYVFDSTGVHYGFFTNTEGVDSVVRLDLTIERPMETSIRVVATNENNRNVVTWNPVSNNTMLGYLVYRQDAYGQYEIMDTVAIDAECSWTDEVSNTAVRPYRYAVATYDSCGNISDMSDSHRTIHLQISLGQGNSRNLSWTDYEGINFSTYRVYRGTSIEDMEMIMEMSRENHTYTDFDVQHDYFYQIEIVQGMKSVVISRSNIVSTNPGGISDIEGIDIAEIALFPNPVTDILNITSSETISEIEIVNVMGQVVKCIEVNADNAVCDVEDLKAGVYIVRIYGTVVSQRKFIKE